MSKLIFDRTKRTLTLVDREGKHIGSWMAGNNVDSSVGLPGLPAGVYRFRQNPHKKHGVQGGDTSSGKFGPMGIFLLEDFIYRGKKHSACGVHSGRKNFPDQSPQHRTGTEHPTLLCVRTTDVAMSNIHLTMMQDPLETLTAVDGAVSIAPTPRTLKTQA